MSIVKLVIGFAMNQANRETKCQEWYSVKNKLLARYGTFVKHDIQFIEGKKCHSCGGTGVYTGYYWSSGEEWHDACYRCYNGWYKRPMWVVLELIQVGKFTFHQPKERLFKKPESFTCGINGYIEHSRGRFGKVCLFLMFLFYEKGYISRWQKTAGIGWRLQWWRPGAWLNNIMHIRKYGKNSYPIKKILNWWNSSGYVPNVVFDYDFFVGRKTSNLDFCNSYSDDIELPF